MKKAKWFFWGCGIALVFGLWWWRLNVTMNEAIIIPDVYYQATETVPFGNNFYWSSNENPNGYTIQINDVQLKETEDFLVEFNAPDDYFPMKLEDGLSQSQYMYDIEVTIKNESNIDGMVQFVNWILIDKSIILRLDTSLLSLCEPSLSGYGSFKLPLGDQRTFHFPFIADPGVVNANSEELYARMKNFDFYLCLSQVPERRLIHIK